MIILTFTFAQALAGSGPGVNIIGVLIIWRFILGEDVGGDHPLSAVIASTVFTAQGWGNLGTQRHFYMEAGNTKLVLAATLVAPLTVHAYKDSILKDDLKDLKHVDYCWRILIALYFRLTIPETPRFTLDIDRDIQRARADIENVLGPNGGSTAVYWVDPDAVVQCADAPCGSRSDFINYFALPGNLLLSLDQLAINANPISYIG
jgi:PHS family inorganic phosphate transporter-like MFS transporter